MINMTEEDEKACLEKIKTRLVAALTLLDQRVHRYDRNVRE